MSSAVGTSRALPPVLGVAGAAAAAAVVAGVGVAVSPPAAAALLVAGAAVYLAACTDIAVVFSAAIALSIFSGNSSYMHFPIGPDRIVFGLGVCLLAWRHWQDARRPGGRTLPTSRFTGVHWLALLAATYAVISALAAGTLTDRTSFFGLLDRFGLVPFAMFFLAPLVFRTERQRRTLIVTLVLVGAYLAITAVGEFSGVNALVVPKYILDPSLGIHYGRARGPFLEAVAMGLALQACGVAAVLLARGTRSRAVRTIAWLVVAGCAIGMIFTLTRAVWIGAAVSTLAVLAAVPALRRWLVPVAVLGVLAVGVVLVAVPGVKDRADARAQAQGPVWDRYNTDKAALRLAEAHPILGSGWNTFITKGPAELRQSADYPLTGAGLNVHNVFLSHATELGLVGFALWLATFLGAIGGALLYRGPPDLAPWRAALLAIAVCWVIVANFGPLGYAFPTLLLWTVAGLVSGHARLRPPS